MSINKPEPLDELEARHSRILQLLRDDLRQRLNGTLPPEHLEQLLLAICSQPPTSADLDAWEPDKLHPVHFSATTGSLLANDAPDDEPTLNREQREYLRETAVLPSRGISDDNIAEAMLQACRNEHPELEERLRSFLERGIE